MIEKKSSSGRSKRHRFHSSICCRVGEFVISCPKNLCDIYSLVLLKTFVGSVRIVLFGPQDATKPLCFFLPASEGTRYLDSNRGIRQVNSKIGYLRHYNHPFLSPPKSRIDFFTFLIGSFSGD